MPGKNANQRFAERLIGQSVQLDRFAAAEQRKVRGTLIQLREELVEKLRKMELEGVSRETFKRARAEKLLDQTRATIGESYAAMSKGLNGTLKDVAEVRSNGVMQVAGSVLTTSLTPQDLRSIVKDLVVDGNPAKEWWKRQSAGLQMNYAREVRVGLAAGETTGDIVRRVRGRDTGQRVVVEVGGKQRVMPKFAGGVMDLPTRQAEALVRTSVQAVSNDVLQETYKANSEVLAGQQLMATLDDRTCPECGGYDGGVWNIETGEPTEDSPVQEPYPGPAPFHYQCRCVWVPVTKSWSQLIKEAGGKPPADLEEVPEMTRASMDGQVAGKMTYDEWLQNQPEAVQKDVLGPGKFQLWQDGKIKSVGQLTNQDGNILTLKELQAKFDPAEVPVPEVLIPPVVDTRLGGGVTPAGLDKDFVGESAWHEPGEESMVPLSRDKRREERETKRDVYSKEFTRRYDDYLDARTERDRDEEAISNYTGSGYTEVNTVLRKLGTLSPTQEAQLALEGRTYNSSLAEARRLQAFILEAPPTKFDMVVYRGDELQFEEGTIQTLKGFTSTSVSKFQATAFGQQALYEIKIPAGSRTLAGFNHYESEVLLPHGAKMKVVGKYWVQISTDRGAWAYQLEYIGV